MAEIKKIEILDERQVFCVAWQLYLDCPLAEADFEALWKLPTYGTRKPRHADSLAFDEVRRGGIFRQLEDAETGAFLYVPKREALGLRAFKQVIREADLITQNYARTVIQQFLRTNAHYFDRRYYDVSGRLLEIERRIRVYKDGVASLEHGRVQDDYWRVASRNPTGDRETLLEAPCASALRQVAWAERTAIRDGSTSFSAEDQREMLKYLLAEGFRRNENADWAYERILRDFTPQQLRAFGAYRLGSYAFWRGHRDWLQNLLTMPPLMDSSSKRFVQALLDGRGSVAAELLTSAWEMNKNRASDYSFRDYPTLMLTLLGAMLSDRGTTQTKRLIAVLHYINGRQQGGFLCEIERVFDEIFLDTVLARRLGERIGGCGQRCDFSSDLYPSEALLLAALVMRGGLDMLGEEVGEEQLGHLQNLAERARNAGYLSVAATLYTVACGACGQSPESPCGLALKEIGDAGGCSFPGGGSFGDSRWEEALEAFEKTVKPEKRTSGRKTKDLGKLWWVVAFCSRYSETRVASVTAAYSKKNIRGEGYGEPLLLSGKKLLSGEYDASMSERDREIKNLLTQDGVISGEYKFNWRAPKGRHLVALCGCDNLLGLTIAGWNDRPSGKPAPLKLDSVESRISLETANGGLMLHVPPKAHANPDSYSLRLISKWHYEVRHCSEDYAKLSALVNRFSGGGSLMIPSEGVAKFEKWMNAVGRNLPFATTGGGPNATASRPALCEPLLRLRYESGELSVHLAVRISREPDLVADPASGLAEKPLTVSDGKSLVLRRDFAAEEKAVEPVRKILLELDPSQTGTNRWSFDGAEESLDALAALHGAEKTGAFALEWPDGKRLDLASVVAHSATFSGGETADYWLSVSGEFKLDDGKVLAFADLLKNFDAREGAYVKLTDARYLKLSAALARRVEALKGAGFERRGEFVIPPAALPSLEKTVRETEADEYLPLPEIVAERIGKIRDAFAATPPIPRTFKGTMRPYQEDGYRWLSRLSDCGIGACLADDMGLGKTIQLIALLAAKKSEGPSLVVAPASVAFNWRNEFARFAPSLKVALVGQTPGAQDEDVGKIAKRNDVVVTSYGVAASRLAAFAPVSWNVLILDEAQAIKNHLTQRAKSVKELKARFRVAATGTPVENRLTELWSIFDFLNPGMLGGETRFAKELAPHGEATPRLKRLVKPLILRRIKRDVLTDLPEKEEITVPVVLGDEERHAYEATRVSALAKLHGGDPQNKIAILAELTRLRRFCCHPSLVMPSVQVGAKLEALERLLAGLKENGHRALVFSQFVDFLSIVRKLLEKNGWSYEYLDGATSKADREKSVGRFQDGDGDFFLISLKAGGMGLNLTAANYVILLDPWWNPAVENQAADRVHRIGQRLPVTVYRLITQDTIEEKVVNLHARKTALAEDILASGASALSAEAMLDLLKG